MIDLHIVLNGWWLGAVLLGIFLLALISVGRTYSLRVKDKE